MAQSFARLAPHDPKVLDGAMRRVNSQWRRCSKMGDGLLAPSEDKEQPATAGACTPFRLSEAG
ncbi:hypothetical protein BD626DRAFT_514178 [Schizophyllum amplum]|uniref:Uncharacterized protein n=1 Tax=Schizophyllum amplum TaxID=97359 RepID=A0A550BYR2_9AGAR|nr:hypothetical protein BD626DRAFT_514178 [Auriculariopsis ampla]